MEQQIKEVVKNAIGKDCVDLSEDYVDLWNSWYRGNVKEFHNYQQYNGKKFIKCKRKTLNMAKKICEDWANLLLNEKTDVAISGEQNQENMNRLLQEIKFWSKGNQGIEKAFALGNGAFVESVDSFGNAKIQFVDRTKMLPITIQDGEITECAFVNINSSDVVVQIHYLVDGIYHIRTIWGKKDKDNKITMFYLSLYGDETKDFDFNTQSGRKWFHTIKPNIVNNIDISSPMGISIFANSLDVLEGVDLAYDGFAVEMSLGKARIFVDSEMKRYGADGEQDIFDANDIAFYIYGYGDSENKEPLKFYAPQLRAESFYSGINNTLNILGSKVGFGENHYRFDGGGVATATQVISENSEMFRSLKKHEIIVNDVIIDIIRTLMYICNKFGNGRYTFDESANIEVKFDDSIIEDKETQKANDRSDVNLGVMSKAEYRAKWYNEDLDTAKTNIEDIKNTQESSIANYFSE